MNKWSGKTDGEVSERGWSFTNMFALITRDQSKMNRRIMFEDVFLFLWTNAQAKAPKRIAEKLLDVADDLELLETEREKWPESDAQLQEWSLQYKDTKRTNPYRIINQNAPHEVTMHNLESKIRHNRMEIAHTHMLLNRRFTKRIFSLTLEHKKTKERMRNRAKLLNRAIPKHIDDRNALVVPYIEGIPEEDLPHFHRFLHISHVNDHKRNNWFW